MKIPLRTFQRSTQALLDVLAINSAPWAEVVDGSGKVVFLAAVPEVIETITRQHRERTGSDSGIGYAGDTLGLNKMATPPLTFPSTHDPDPMASVVLLCDKCKEQGGLRKWAEDGMDYKICIVCALKAKLPWHKLEVI